MTVPRDAVVTALVPVRHHRADFLRAAIGSLLDQSSPSWAAVVVVAPEFEDVVTAALADVVDDPRIRMVPTEGRALAGALNTGMRHATTDFVAILLADDLWATDAVAVLERRIREAPDVDFFHSARRVVDEAGRPISSVLPARPNVTLADFASVAPVKHLLCWRRELALSIGGMDESLPPVGPDDFDFPWSMAEHGARFAAIDECLYVVRDHRAHPRLTIDLPRTVHVRTLRRIFRKHGLPRRVARRRIRQARRGYLRQCRYRSHVHRVVARALRIEPTGRQEVYR